MLISSLMLILGGFHLLLLIAVVYMLTFLKMHHSIRIHWLDMLIIAAQMFNLVVSLQVVVDYDSGILMAEKSIGLLFAVQSVFTALLLIRIYFMLRKILSLHRMLLIPQSIREAIDYLPGGICFSTPKGKPVLTNRRMNELIYRLTDHTIMNMQQTWDDLRQFGTANGCTKLEDPWLDQGNISGDVDGCTFFSFPNGAIWRFSREELSDREPHYVQMEATDITDLYNFSKELYENNQRLARQFERQKNLLENIVDINREKEILATKMRIHDDLGRSIITTKQHLWNQTLSGNIPHLAEIWTNTIRNLTDFTQISTDADVSPEVELLRAADIIGCQINFIGERPSNRKTALLLYASVREALTNAVKHAKADRLNVVIDPTERGYDVEISDNGSITVESITEGSGLSNLRKRLEQEGATLVVKCGVSVVLKVQLPA